MVGGSAGWLERWRARGPKKQSATELHGYMAREEEKSVPESLKSCETKWRRGGGEHQSYKRARKLKGAGVAGKRGSGEAGRRCGEAEMRRSREIERQRGEG